MGGRAWLRWWAEYEVQNDLIEGAGSCEPPTSHDCIHTITDHIWIVYADLGYHPRTITNAKCDFSTGKWSAEAGFAETSLTPTHSISPAWQCTRFVTDSECKARWTHQLLLMHIVSQANYHIEFGFGRRQGDGSWVASRVYSKIYYIDDVSPVKAICVPILLHVSCFWISVAEL